MVGFRALASFKSDPQRTSNFCLKKKKILLKKIIRTMQINPKISSPRTYFWWNFSINMRDTGFLFSFEYVAFLWREKIQVTLLLTFFTLHIHKFISWKVDVIENFKLCGPTWINNMPIISICPLCGIFTSAGVIHWLIDLLWHGIFANMTVTINSVTFIQIIKWSSSNLVLIERCFFKKSFLFIV